MQALWVALIALLPGAAFTYAYERGAGSYGVTRADRLVRFLTASAGFQALPRAWDYLWATRPAAVVRMRLKSAKYIAGVYGPLGDLRSYAAAFPEDGDLFFTQTVAVDADTGEFITDDDGVMKFSPIGLLVRWSEPRRVRSTSRHPIRAGRRGTAND